MSGIRGIWQGTGRTIVAGAPEGMDAAVLAALALEPDAPTILHVALDDARMAELAELIA